MPSTNPAVELVAAKMLVMEGFIAGAMVGISVFLLGFKVAENKRLMVLS